ncbi:MAG: ABC transporter substrate-binding protein [Pseudonocardia sp.]|uniref:ABC transporter substrate-binding protein n=1 Tax=unclassified Pseudonocardia TaxID=2619320 RepID=UPI001AC50BB5|nr:MULTISPECIES: ABC transporter substrate-binding protein [unclassified Pseudonocardia]MBN9111695.1 ABC transporter substrate-binding protein [Pseudonocardia sp.]
MNRRLRWVATAVASVVALATLAGCGSSTDEVAASESGRIPLRVTSLGLCNEIALYAQDAGIFAKHGLDVELVKSTGGNAGIAAVQSGSADVAFVSSAAIFNALAQGLPLTIVSGSGVSTPESHGVIVAADSPARGPADLSGKTVAVNELTGTGAVLTSRWITDAGGTAPKFTALPFPELATAVANKAVDGAQVTSTEIFEVTKAGTGRSIGNPIFDAAGGATPTALYATSNDFLAKNQKAVVQFTDAMDEAAKAGNDKANNAQKFDIFSKYCKRPAADLAQIAEQGYAGRIDRGSFMRMKSILAETKAIPADFPVETKVADFAWTTG